MYRVLLFVINSNMIFHPSGSLSYIGLKTTDTKESLETKLSQVKEKRLKLGEYGLPFQCIKLKFGELSTQHSKCALFAGYKGFT